MLKVVNLFWKIKIIFLFLILNMKNSIIELKARQINTETVSGGVTHYTQNNLNTH